MAQLHVRLPDDTKSEWETYAEEHGYGSLSRLIRQAVENERSDGGGANASVTVPDDIARQNDIRQVDDTLLRLTDRFDKFERLVEQAARRQIEPTNKMGVLNALPSERPTSSEPRLLEADGIALDGQPETIAKLTDEYPSAVRYYLATEALESDRIHTTTVDGERVYWSEMADIDDPRDR